MDVAVFLRQLAALEEKSAKLYHRLRPMTFLSPRVSNLFERLSQDELGHMNLINTVKEYQSQAESDFEIQDELGQDVLNAQSILTDLDKRISADPPRPPFRELLGEVLDFEKTLEGRHFSSYLRIRDEELRNLLLQLNQYDKDHVAAIARLIAEIDSPGHKEPQP